MDFYNRLFPANNGDSNTHLWVAIFVLAAMGFLVAVKKGLGPGEVI